MRQLSSTLHIRLLSSLLACSLAIPAIAQQRSGEDEESRRTRAAQQDRQQGERQQAQQRSGEDEESRRTRAAQQSRQQGERQQAQQRQDRRQGERQSARQRVRVEPRGLVNIGVDYDGDGRFDAVETIYVYDLEMARRQSQRRQQTAQRERQVRSQRTVSVEGEVRDLREIRMHDEDASYLVARVRTDNGRTAKVLLGKDSQLSQLNLSEGDDVEVEGRRGTINQQGILVATQIRAGDREVQVQQKRMGRDMEQLQGSVIRTRGAKFRGHDDTFLIAEIRGDDGRRRIVNMGPKQKFDDVEFSDVGEIRVLGHRGNISGRDALIAEQVFVDGETIRIAPDERRDQQWREQQRDQRRGDSRDWERQDRDRQSRYGQSRERQDIARQDRDRQELNRQNRDRQDRDRQDFRRQNRERQQDDR